ncbi:MAG: hypothetical protein CMH28_03880 [Micavibrio sp.]|nr:hypothetical protein [Micavibrio sp.]|tara:strand:+ start:464 stop:844 length:381 start_codon:yes stop_codon:yes gene_type:complete
MLDKKFSSAKAATKFTYKHIPHHKRSYEIMALDAEAGYKPVGQYTVLDLSEEANLSEKKVMNLISIMNGKSDLIDISGDVAGSRLYFNEGKEERGRKKVVFYKQDGTGVSRENALLLINKEVWGNA